MTAPDLTVVVNLHAEGALAHRTLRSANAAVSRAVEDGFVVERLLVVDRPTAATARYLGSGRTAGWRCETIDVGDLSLARNHGAYTANGRLIAFLDGDDLFGQAWLARALLHAATRSDPKFVLHPQWVITMGAQRLIARHQSSTDMRFREATLIERNPWTAVLLAHRELVVAVPFVQPRSHAGFYEDWHWVCSAMATGAQVHAVPDTVVFVRRRKRSLLLERGEGLLMPCPLFERAGQPAPESTHPASLGRASAPIRDGFERSSSRAATVLRRAGRASVLRVPTLMPLARVGMRLLARAEGRDLRFLPRCLVDDLRAIHQVEPDLFPDTEITEHRWYDPAPPPRMGHAFTAVLPELPLHASHMLLVAWLKRGGADLEAINYANALAEAGARQVCVVATEDTGSPWAHRLRSEVAFVELSRKMRGLTQQEQESLLASLILQSQVPVVHILNSRLAYLTWKRFGGALAAYTQLFVSVFCEDVKGSGRKTGYAFRDLPEIEPFTSAIFADNKRILDLLEDTFAFDADKLFVHYQPQDPLVRPHRASRPTLNVLWAGRLDRQKRPDVLLQIARRCVGLPIRFFAYGDAMLDPLIPPGALKGINLEHRGGFDGLASLPLAEFDVFLNTSQWEGLPNILLEAISAGMPVVSSSVGGIPELIENGVTGMLVDPFDDAAGYQRRLGELASDQGLRQRIADNALAKVEEGHSRDRFRNALLAVPGYL